AMPHHEVLKRAAPRFLMRQNLFSNFPSLHLQHPLARRKRGSSTTPSSRPLLSTTRIDRIVPHRIQCHERFVRTLSPTPLP
ncbi:MAG: hypothetical protein ABW107_23395, partial [Candidatus Thiodiazotropha sp. 6PLUC5]